MSSSTIKRIISLYNLNYEKSLCYMLQRTNYDVHKFLKWYLRFPNFQKVNVRGELKKTLASKSILIGLRFIRVTITVFSIYLILSSRNISLGVGLLLLSPLIQVLILIPTLPLIRSLLIVPSQNKAISKAEKIFMDSKAIKIVILGSYGKTTVKELLANVLSSKYKVAYTHDNLNTQIAHSRFAQKLKGDEDFIIVELGEEKPGDIAKMASVIHPDYAIVTGMAPVHLDHMKSIEAISDDLSSILNFVDKENIFWNKDSEYLNNHIGKSLAPRNAYSTNSALNNRISHIDATLINGVSFKLNDTTFKTRFVGRHLIPSLALMVTLGEKFEIPTDLLKDRIKEAQPFSARMQVVKVGPAHVINDGYNGNIEGIQAGISTLSELKASGKKLYATPGLIAQGNQNDEVHRKIALLLSKTNFDLVYLFENKNTKIIQAELKRLKSDIRVELVKNPLEFLENLHSFLANGDVLLIQNDLPDEA